MSEDKNILEGVKVLSIADANGVAHNFVAEAEDEEYTLKMKYYMWLSRLFMFLTIIFLGFFTSASLVLFKLSPQVNVEPFLIIRQDKSDNMVRYEPIAQDMASKAKLMELFLKQYVIIRNTVVNDSIEMRSRWYPGGMVNYLSAPRVFYEFPEKNEDEFRKIIENGVVREVDIISVTKQGGERSTVWKVDFKTYDLSERGRDGSTGAMVLKTRYWTASITAYFIPFRTFVGLRLINPLGFTVTRYSQTEVNIY